MTQQTQQLIDAGYVTRKQAAAILGKGDGSNVTEACHRGGVKFIEIPRGDKRVTTLFWGEDVVRLFAKMDRKNRPKVIKEGDKVRGGTAVVIDRESRTPIQCELPVVGASLPEPPGKRLSQDTFFTPPGLLDFVPAMQSKRMLLIGEHEIIDTLGRIEAMLTALLGRSES
jgi:hypothetical protein